MVAAGAALAALAGCAGGVSTQTDVVNRDLRGHIQYAAANGPTQIAIYNSPFDSTAVLAAVQRRNPGPPMTFATTPSPANYRVMLLFGLIPSTNPCQSPAPAVPAPASDRMMVSAVFCIGTAEISEARAATAPIASAADPRFVRLMQDLLSALMPYNDPLYNNDTSDTGM
jgi:hypothetical protein